MPCVASSKRRPDLTLCEGTNICNEIQVEMETCHGGNSRALVRAGLGLLQRLKSLTCVDGHCLCSCSLIDSFKASSFSVACTYVSSNGVRPKGTRGRDGNAMREIDEPNCCRGSNDDLISVESALAALDVDGAPDRRLSI